ncbi:uncharacterized protein G2W53_018202 [Senna tora]|uniref:Uncharacterized protein n=1 Tax=Senna tora TaxID=362788 RepID=A0A834TQX8_9FABA|nr:uncharacterized protein G2W53_018202 [Senna tora]
MEATRVDANSNQNPFSMMGEPTTMSSI